MVDRMNFFVRHYSGFGRKEWDNTNLCEVGSAIFPIAPPTATEKILKNHYNSRINTVGI